MSRKYPKIDDSLDQALDEELSATDFRAGRTTSNGDPAIAPSPSALGGRQVTVIAAEARQTALQNVVSGVPVAGAGRPEESLLVPPPPANTTPMTEADERKAPSSDQQQQQESSSTAPQGLGGRQITTIAAQARVTALQNVVSTSLDPIRRVATEAAIPPPPASEAMASAPASFPGNAGDMGDSEKDLQKRLKDRFEKADAPKILATSVDHKTIGPDEKWRRVFPWTSCTARRSCPRVFSRRNTTPSLEPFVSPEIMVPEELA